MSWRALARLPRALVISTRPTVGPMLVQRRPSTRIDKMIATRVTESYARLLLNSKDGDSRHVVIDKIGAYEVRLLEIPSVNGRQAASLWVELYDRGLRTGVDSCKCGDVGEVIEAARFLLTQATRIQNEAA